ncbi:hypothetical protein [Polaribacter tangerinus]|uniref:hypothetical protein n=1 Tax=Polaribacter tangerinus TaxID=1920034 RepID=UPI000B4BDE89|nr:hypothetical protein [Polaribacter tangerinus]
MINKILFSLFFLIGLTVYSQNFSSDFRTKKMLVKNDTLKFDFVAINPKKIEIFDTSGKLIPSKEYQVDYNNATLYISAKKYAEITIKYFRLPEFLTKTYKGLDKKLIVPNGNYTSQLYSLTTNKKSENIALFEGLKTKGFISRGITSGNNQNAVTNAALDLEIEGKLSDKVSLKASIWDTNIPIQENGYSQNITDFDRIFIEMYTENWRVKAGDISLENNTSFFAPFKKQAAGLQVQAKINKKLQLSASGAVVRGKFNNFRIVGVEGNQGPYKIFGANNEPAILIIAGSEQVYVNGLKINRGENKDYLIDYNLGEITFNTTYPITNDMRITIEFQYSDRNYTRFVTYEEAKYESEKLKVSSFFYSEKDAKNQPLQQVLTEKQIENLKNAGNNKDLMVFESAFLDSFDENKILYKKTLNGAVEIFEYSKNPSDILYFVTFTNVGNNNGNYILERNTAIGNIYKYAGVNLGNYSPIIRLIAPTKAEIFVVKSDFNPHKNTKISSEIAISNNDANLFSSIDNQENAAIAAKVGWEQHITNKKWQFTTNINHEYAHKNFKTLQRWESIEFNRDWNLLTNNATKNYFQSSFTVKDTQNNFLMYRFNHLNYLDTYNGNKHEVTAKMEFSKTLLTADVSYLNNNSSTEKNSFLVAKTNIEQQFDGGWFGAFTNIERNSRVDNLTKKFVNTSHQFQEYEGYFGVGNTAGVFAKLGYNYRDNDSIKQESFTKINTRKTVYLTSKIVQNKNSNLSIFANYRTTENSFSEDEKSLNSKITFNQKLFNNLVNSSTVYETSSGNVARQEYIYIKTAPGLGFYTWLDYNNDGVQDFDEFEVAEFQDQANYLRVPKPNIRFIATQKATYKQILNFNFYPWKKKKGIKKLISHFSSDHFLSIENEQRRIGDSFKFNPFNFNENNLLGLNLNIKNSLFINRNLQKYSLTYSYGKLRNKQQFIIGTQENKLENHQIDFAHKFANFWLFEAMVKKGRNNLDTENFNNRNYRIKTEEITPKISFLYNKNNRFSAFYHFKNKVNTLINFEKLQQQKVGLEYFYMGRKKNQVSANFNLFVNSFKGNTNTPVAYQMLEGLQAGNNYTWNLLFNRKLNDFLHLNISYLGRKSELSKAIHTGSVQLRATF